MIFILFYVIKNFTIKKVFFFQKILYICTIKFNKGTYNENNFYYRPHRPQR